jgi:hypothetical protein
LPETAWKRGPNRRVIAVPISRINPLKAFLLTLTVGLLLLGSVSVTPASAKRPCWKDVASDWFSDLKVDGTYAPHCYRDAIKHLPPVTDSYSTAREEIKRAMLYAIAHPTKPSGPDRTPTLGQGLGPGEGGDAGLIQSLLEKLGPKNADAIPLPLLVLAGISLLLLGTAGASYVARRVQAKRLEPAPPTEPEPQP